MAHASQDLQQASLLWGQSHKPRRPALPVHQTADFFQLSTSNHLFKTSHLFPCLHGWHNASGILKLTLQTFPFIARFCPQTNGLTIQPRRPLMHQINHEIPSSSSSLSFAPPATSVAAMSLGFAASATSQSISSYSTPFLTLTPTPYGNSTWGNGTSAGAENGECRLLGPFALLVQAALGLLALLSLVFKRWRERPQRPVKIWGFDASKQVVGSSLLHVANLFMSMVSSGSGDLKPKAGDFQANPCSFYLLNLAIDVSTSLQGNTGRLLTYGRLQ